MIFLLLTLSMIYRYILNNDLPKKILFYTRPEMKIRNDQINLYLDIDPKTLLHKTEVHVQYDFMFNHILINSESFKCSSNNCIKGSERKTDIYNGQKYEYYDVNTFVGIQKLSPAEIASDLQKPLSQGYIRLIETQNIPNVVGLGPNSDFFETINTEYHLYDQKLNITYCNYDDKKHFRYNSRIDDADLIQDIDSFKDYYIINGQFQIQSKTDSMHILFSIGSDEDYYFSLNDSLYKKLMNSFCKNQNQCNNYDHLSNVDFEVTFEFKGIDKISKKLTFKADQLYELDSHGNIIWKIKKFDDKYKNLNVDIVLEKLFFGKFYFLITKNFKGKFFVGLRRVVATDFWIDNLWKYFLMIIILSLVFLVLSNLALKYFRKKNKSSHQKQRLIQQELKEFEDLRKLNQKNQQINQYQSIKLL